jgi:hypothetical protein
MKNIVILVVYCCGEDDGMICDLRQEIAVGTRFSFLDTVED